MKVQRGFYYIVCSGVAALLYGSAADLDRRANAALPSIGKMELASADSAVVDLKENAKAKSAVPDLNASVRARDSAPDLFANPDGDERSLEALDQCLLANDCIDQYLFSIYARTIKIDTMRVTEQLKTTVKKKGKLRTITKTVVKLVDNDFTWKDPEAAEKARMSLQEYVIGGMDRSFKAKLYRLARALENEGLAPGITSGFRDNYRQSIASGNKAAIDSSYHGGSKRGGYGFGLAADLVGVTGDTHSERLTSSQVLWKWIDEHGAEFGIGRPYLDRDPPHVGPIEGREYVQKRALFGAKRAGL